MNSVEVVVSDVARVFRTLAVAGLLAVTMGAALGAIAGARGGTGAPRPALPVDAHRLGALGATGPYTTEPTVSPTTATTTTATVTATEPAATATSPDTPTPLITSTVTATVTITEPAATATPTDTPTPPITPTVTASPTPSETPTPTDTPTLAPTQPPRPAYLPLTVRDPDCIPEVRHSDIVFLLDVSTYMRQMINGRPSFEWAKDWMRATVERIDMTRARIGIVHFNREVDVVQTLTNNRQDVLDAIEAGPTRNNGSTRMDMGLLAARNILVGGGTPGNAKVIFFISLMQAKGVPWRQVPGCVEKRGEECAVIAAANEVKTGPDPITIYALALSWYGGGEDLKAVASDPDKAYLLPSEAEWAKIYSELQSSMPCPADLFWTRSKP